MDIAERLAKIWAEVFEIDSVGPDSDFFDLGGGSLQATAIAARLRSELDVDIPLRVFFESSTVAELAAAIEALP
jgi:acyl carrier protein